MLSMEDILKKHQKKDDDEKIASLSEEIRKFIKNAASVDVGTEPVVQTQDSTTSEAAASQIPDPNYSASAAKADQEFNEEELIEYLKELAQVLFNPEIPEEAKESHFVEVAGIYGLASNDNMAKTAAVAADILASYAFTKHVAELVSNPNTLVLSKQAAFDQISPGLNYIINYADYLLGSQFKTADMGDEIVKFTDLIGLGW